MGKHNGAGIHHVDRLSFSGWRSLLHPPLRKGAKSRCQCSASSAECLISGQPWKPFRQMVFGIVVDRFLLESPLADAPQVNGNTLLISKLGTEIVALALHFSFDYATIVADSAI